MVSHMLLNALIGAASCAGAAFVVLPSLAGDEVYSNVAAAIRHTGHSLSGYTFCIGMSHRSMSHCNMFMSGVATSSSRLRLPYHVHAAFYR